MTIDERVEWCLDQKGGRPLFGDEARAILRQAITTAVEEERAEEATRSLIEIDRAIAIEAAREEERDSCATILEIEAARYEAGFPGLTERKVAELLLTLATKIRARGAEKDAEKK